ncbi:hypothetical protein HK102_012542, partial [Quaeritorhiza haematococci]
PASEAIPLLSSYFHRFGSAYSCFDDLKPYLTLLTSPSDITTLTTQLTSFLQKQSHPQQQQQQQQDADEKTEKHKTELVKYTVNAKKVERFYSAGWDRQRLEAEVGVVVGMWRDAEPLGKGLKETENKPGDDYLILAAHYLGDVYRDDG